MQLERNTLIKYGSLLFFIKILYIYSVALMLPDVYLLWTYDKSIQISNIVIEIIPFFICLLLLINYCKYNNIYSFFLVCFFVLFYIPQNSTLSVNGYLPLYFILVNLFSALIIISVGEMSKKDKFQATTQLSLREKLFSDRKLYFALRIVLIVISVASIFRAYLYNGLNFSVFFSEMYETRADYADYAASITGSLSSYVILFITNIASWMVPIYLFFSLINKKILDILLSLFTLLAIFTIEMQKSQLMIIAVIFFVYYIERRKKINRICEIVLFGFLGIFIVSLIEYYVTGSSNVFTLIIRRMFYGGTYSTYKHYLFFMDNTKLVFSQDAFILQNIVSKLWGRSYPTSAVKVISENCYSGLLPSPNAGMFAETIAQLGVAGIFIFPLIYRFIVGKMKKAACVYGNDVAMIVIFMLILKFTNVYILASASMVGVVTFYLLAMTIKHLSFNLKSEGSLVEK